MTDNLEHREMALASLDYAGVAQTELNELRAHPEAPQRHQRISQLHQDIGHSLKLAHIHATLDVAAAFRDWTEISHDGVDPHDDDPGQATLIPLPTLGQSEDNQ